MKKNTYTILAGLFLAVIICFAGCGGGGDSTPVVTAPAILPYSPPINWIGNTNGVNIKDATNDNVTFRTDNGQMIFGNTTYYNMRVIPGAGGDLYFNGVKVGAVTMIRGAVSGFIGGLVCNNGTMMDIFGWESTLSVQCTTTYPVYKITAKGAVFVDAQSEEALPNAFIQSTIDSSNQKSTAIQFIEK